MATKTDQVKVHLAVGDYRGALRVASKFRMLGEHKLAVQQAWSALNSADFYRQIGKDPDALVAAGVQALQQMYGS